MLAWSRGKFNRDFEANRGAVRQDGVYQTIVLIQGWPTTCRGRGRVGGWLSHQSGLSSLAALAVGMPD